MNDPAILQTLLLGLICESPCFHGFASVFHGGQSHQLITHAGAVAVCPQAGLCHFPDPLVNPAVSFAWL